MTPVVGIDFDNTVVDYGRLFKETAVAMGLSLNGGPESKEEVRDLVRNLPDGELNWQRLQASIYGPEIQKAIPSPGVKTVLTGCKQRGLEVYIVSHKTQFAAQDNGGVDIREAAISWLVDNNFLKESETGIDQSRVYFEDSRHEKVLRIRALGCTHFIDDLAETFLEPSFPDGVTKILYSPRSNQQPNPGILVADGWDSAARLVFDDFPAN